MRKYLTFIWRLAALAAIAYALYHLQARQWYFGAIAVAATALVRWLLNRERPLTKFGNNLMSLRVGFPILAFALPLGDCIVLGFGYFLYIVWDSEEKQDTKPDSEKDQEKSRTERQR